MQKNLVLATAACALSLALVGCGGGPALTGATSSSEAEGSPQTTEPSNEMEPAENNHYNYFVGQWDLYESDQATHEQIVQTMEKYVTDEETHAQMNEAYGRDDDIWFCARFAADGTGEIDTGTEVVSFSWEATNEGAVTFTSFGGKETAIHLPVTDGKFTLNGDTYAKVD